MSDIRNFVVLLCGGTDILKTFVSTVKFSEFYKKCSIILFNKLNLTINPRISRTVL